MFRLSKKKIAQRERIIEDTVAELNESHDERKVQPSLEENYNICKSLFKEMDLIHFRMIESNGDLPRKFFIVFCDGMVNQQIINDNLVCPLMLKTDGENSIEDIVKGIIQIGESQTSDNFKDIVERVTSGETALFADGCDHAAVFNTKKFKLRGISEPDSEKTLSGPREGFTEDLISNLSQIVRRLHTNDLKTQMITLGRLTKTKVCICYLDSIVDKNILNSLFERLNKIDIDGIIDSNYITELIEDKSASPFRTIGSTERPDVVVGKILEGRIALFVDGTPFVLTVPYLFIENFQSNEDYYLNFYYTSFTRFLRICGFFLTVVVPGIYIAVVAYHPEMLPLQLLIRLSIERQNVPLPAALEAIVMLIVFDILRETGVRMPSNIGQTLSIVGALVIGQAAVEASLIAAPMIIVVSATGITALLVPRLSAPIIIFRFLLLALASAFGFYGLTIGIIIMMIHINNLTSFGVQQVQFSGEFKPSQNKDLVIRAPIPTMIDRPEMLTKNIKRQTRRN